MFSILWKLYNQQYSDARSQKIRKYATGGPNTHWNHFKKSPNLSRKKYQSSSEKTPALSEQNSSPFRTKLQSFPDKTGFSFGDKFQIDLSKNYLVLPIQAHIRTQNPQTTNRIPVVLSWSPRPTNGDTNPPKAKETAPNKAEALPEYCRPLSIAKVVAEVKQRPRENRIPRIKHSYNQKEQPENNAIISPIEKNIKP